MKLKSERLASSFGCTLLLCLIAALGYFLFVEVPWVSTKNYLFADDSRGMPVFFVGMLVFWTIVFLWSKTPKETKGTIIVDVLFPGVVIFSIDLAIGYAINFYTHNKTLSFTISTLLLGVLLGSALLIDKVVAWRTKGRRKNTP